MTLLDLLPNDLFRDIVNHWVESNRELKALDTALCNHELRYRYLSWPKQLKNPIELDESATVLEKILQWAGKRKISIKSLTIYVDQICIPQKSYGAQVEELIIKNGLEEIDEGFSTENLEIPLFRLLSAFPTIKSLQILCSNSFNLEVDLTCKAKKGGQPLSTDLSSIRCDDDYFNEDDNEDDERPSNPLKDLLSVSPSLTALHIGNARLRSVSKWIRTPALLQDVRFYFSNSIVSNSIEPFFRQLTALHTLALGGEESLTNDNWQQIVNALPNPQQIRELRLIHAYNLTSDALRALPIQFPQLQSLVLSIQVSQVKDLEEIIQSAAAWKKNLTCFQLSLNKEWDGEELEDDFETPLTDRVIRIVDVLSSVRNLRVVFEGCEFFETRKTIHHILEKYPFATQLRELTIRANPRDRDRRNVEVNTGNWKLINLRLLDLKGVYFPSSSSIDDITDQCEYLQRYYLQYSKGKSKIGEVGNMYQSYCDYRSLASEAVDDMGRPLFNY
jgi:hypothetical protein